MKSTISILIVLSIATASFGQSFIYHSDSPFGIQLMREDSTRSAQNIHFFDYDGDGDLDLFLTGIDSILDFNHWGDLRWFIELQINTGTPTDPQFGDRQEIFTPFPYPVGYFFVSPGDLNNDGKTDFIVSAEIDYVGNQKVLMLINTGRSSAPFDIIPLDSFGLIDFVPESFFVPHLTDLDGDGDLDLMNSGANPAFAVEDGPDEPIFYYGRNTDIRSGEAGFEGWYPNPYGVTPDTLGEILTSGDIDNDGDMDFLGFLLGIPADSNNHLLVHLNTPVNDHPSFTSVLQSPYGLPSTYGTEQLLFPSLVDIDGDDDLDLFVFDGNSNNLILKYYENDLCMAVTNELVVTICEGETYSAGGQQFSVAGEYTLVLEAQNGCDSIIHLVLTVEALPTSNLNVTICEGESFTLAGETFSTSGAYMVLVAASNGCDTLVLLTLEVVTVDVTVTQQNQTLTANQAGASYQWINCGTGEDIPGETGQSFEVTETGSYAVSVEFGPDCTSESECITVMITSVEEDIHLNKIVLYPNPSEGLIFILNKNAVPITGIKAIDLSGREILRMENLIGDQIDLRNFERGSYFIWINTSEGVIVEKVLIL